jgi:hypothetical protein
MWKSSQGTVFGSVQPDCGLASFTSRKEEEDPMKHAQNRLATFTEWPKHFHMEKNKLASAGFCYTGKGDKVVCFSCKVLLNNWAYGDRPLQEHHKFSSGCNFLKTCYCPDQKKMYDTVG